MSAPIPDERWNPLSLAETVALLADAPFQWCLGGGYAVEQFLGAPIRTHDDVDVVVFRGDQLKCQRWLAGWELYAADPPGTLRKWRKDEFLPFGVHDIWGYKPPSDSWQLQLMLAEVDGDDWYNRRNPLIRGRRDDLIVEYNGLPCIRIEVQLMYKSKGLRPKDELDFQAALPRMSAASKRWLKNALLILYPDRHPWLEALR
jgi:hypothetical protein